MEKRKKITTNLLYGEVNRHWEFVDKNGGRHVLSLIHDCVSGVRVCLLDYEELKSSFGTTNVINTFFGRTPIYFQIKQTGEWGMLEIRKDGLFGFEYSCEVSRTMIPEKTSVIENSEHEFEVRISGCDLVYAAGSNDPIAHYIIKTKRIRDNLTTEVHRRYNEFFMLHENCEAMLRGNHLSKDLPPIPEKRPFGRLDSSFIESRRVELECYIRTLLRIPHVGSFDMTKAFLGIVGDSFESSHVIRSQNPPFELSRKDTLNGVASRAWCVVVSGFKNGAPAGIQKYSKVLRVAGIVIYAQHPDEIEEIMRKAKKPYLIHFLSQVEYSDLSLGG